MPRQCNPFEWNGVLYPSMYAAAKALNTRSCNLYYYKTRGYKCDADVIGNAQLHVWDGQTYVGLREMAYKTGIPYTRLRHYTWRGYTSMAQVGQRKMKK